MHKESKIKDCDNSGGNGSVKVIGIGPGGRDDITERALTALKSADIVVGYSRYIELVSPFIDGIETYETGMTGEVERCRKALEFARAGKDVAVVSSGDAGI
ncbi:MAG: hypothetical protein GY771_07640, partial [bacterium]|nr:hypothetical protein [bacterium]